MQVTAPHSADLERAELEVVLEALARTPRLAKLLEFLGEKFFQGRTDEISEYSIATEVFGRSKLSFDGSRDSIARVETHRLRKRLKEYYGADGKEHAIAISLPFRCYIPEFKRRAVSTQAPVAIEAPVDARNLEDLSSTLVLKSDGRQSQAADAHGATEIEMPETRSAEPSRLQNRAVLYGLAAMVVLLLLSFGRIRFFSGHRSASTVETAGAHSSSATQQPMPADAAQVPLRLLAGYHGSPRIDSAGAYWEADRYFHGGGAFRRPNVPVARTSDQMLFDYWRVGDFTYDIPLAPGPYELHLFFVASEPEDSKTGFFNISVNGQQILKGFNIDADDLGINISDERVFKDIYPDKDGYLHLAFLMERSSPSVNAIEILPGLTHRQLPVRLVMQPMAVTDSKGNVWRPDDYFQSGTYSDQPRQVSGTSDPKLYERERYGHFTYSIPVDTHGRYTLVLHFAELYWVPDLSKSVGVGSRAFRVYCNGSTLLDNFDIFKQAGGSMRAMTKTFYHLRPSTEGKLDLTFEPFVNFATVSAIEVLDESE